ncbi:hypothetical protein CD798_13960 [Bacillaceae bacterium SAOS 7]|nr:hypothetical protein CD798_13960 [Bacillaceae bacterium SAOS 7]
MLLNSFVLNMLYLYFPEDKSEYIPAAISMAVFMTAAVLFFLFMKKISKKEEEKAKELEGKYKIGE